MTEESSRKFKILSFIFTVVIVLYHANGVFSTHFNLPGNIAVRIDNVVNFIATIAMAYFFMTSGFFFTGTPRERMLHRRSSADVYRCFFQCLYGIVFILQKRF